MTEETYGILFGAATAPCLVAPLWFHLVQSRRAHRSFSSGNAAVPVQFGAFKRLAARQNRLGQLIAGASFGAITVIMGSRISDIGALLVLPPLLAIAVFAAGPLRRTKRLRRMRPDASRTVVSDGERLFLVEGARLVTWLAASPAALAEAGVFPAAQVHPTQQG